MLYQFAIEMNHTGTAFHTVNFELRLLTQDGVRNYSITISVAQLLENEIFVRTEHDNLRGQEWLVTV